MPKIFMASLGCAKNLVDAEIMLGETLGDEFELVLDPASADVVLVNTCGFIEEAREEGRAVLAEYLDLKERSGRRLKVVATGCWAQRWPEELRREFPGLDGVWGLSIPSSLAPAIRDLAKENVVAGLDAPAGPREGARLLTTLPSYAYLRISDGCDNRCNYCAIPLIRGGLKSRRPEAILGEARELEDQGAKELIVISQDTTAYGRDLAVPGVGLASLLERLLAAVRVPRIRVLYAHPAHLDDRVTELLLGEPRLCRYLDLPLQHISDAVLRGMGRGYGKEDVMRILDAFSDPSFTLRTTFLTGFPGETEADFQELLALVKEGRFQHLGAFAYSPERETPAFSFPDQVPAEEAARRRDALLEAQAAVAFSWLDSRVGGTERILLDAWMDDEWLLGRSVREAPDADGTVFVRSGKSGPGQLVDACIKAREGYDLLAEPVREGKNRRRPRR